MGWKWDKKRKIYVGTGEDAGKTRQLSSVQSQNTRRAGKGKVYTSDQYALAMRTMPSKKQSYADAVYGNKYSVKTKTPNSGQVEQDYRNIFAPIETGKSASPLRTTPDAFKRDEKINARTPEKAAYDPTEIGFVKDYKADVLKPITEAETTGKSQLNDAQEQAQKKIAGYADKEKPLLTTNPAKTSGKNAGQQGYIKAMFSWNPEERNRAIGVLKDASNAKSALRGLDAYKKDVEKDVDKTIYERAARLDEGFEQAAKQGGEYKSKLSYFLKSSDLEKFAAVYSDDNASAMGMLTPDELATYNYYLAKNNGDETVANKYLDSLMPDLQERIASALDENIESIDNEVGKKAMRGTLSAAGGLKNAGRALQNIPAAFTGSDEVILPGVVQQAQQKMRSRLEGPEAFVNDALYSGTQMFPAIIANAIPGVGQVAGTAMVMATSYSDAYSGAIAQGYDPSEAVAYAIPSAVAEGLTQYALNGVKAFGASSELGKIVSNAAQNVSKNPAVQKVMVSLGNMGGEALEEYLQANIDPILRNLALGEDNEINPFSQDKLEAALMGAVLSGAMNAPEYIADATQSRAQNKAQQQLTDDIYVNMGTMDALNNPIVAEADSIVSNATGQDLGELIGNRALTVEAETQADAIVNNAVPDYIQPRHETRKAGESTQDAEWAAGYEPQATKVKNPYSGAVPVQKKRAGRGVALNEKSLADAEGRIAEAQKQPEKSFKGFLTQAYNALFDQSGGARGVAIDGMTFDGKPYVVTLNKNIIRKVINDKNLSAQKLAVFDAIDDVVESANYVGSGEYGKNEKAKGKIRYDYFETPIRIGDEDYIAAFDVEVLPSANNYRTHKIINKIDLTKASSADTAPEAAAKEAQSSLSNQRIAQEGEKVKEATYGWSNKKSTPSVVNALNTESNTFTPETAEPVPYEKDIDELLSVGRQLPTATRSSDILSDSTILHEGEIVNMENGTGYKKDAGSRAALQGKTIYIKKDTTSGSDASTETPIRTSETTEPVSFSTYTIPQTDEYVNPKYSIGQDLSGIENIEKEAMQHISDADAPPAEYAPDNTFLMEPEAELEAAVAAHDAQELEYARQKAKEQIAVNPKKEKVTARQALSEFIDGVQRKFIDSGHEVAKLGEKPEYYLNSARDALQSADYNVGYARGKETHQTDIFGRGNRGKSLAAIYEKINAAGERKVSDFSEYMYHLHNADRMGLVARAQKNIAKLNSRIAELLGDPDIASEYRGLQEAAISTAEISDGLKEVLRLENDIANLKLVNNKPIFGNEITAEQSKQIASGLLKKNKEFAAWEAEVRQYVKNNMELRIEAGLTSREFADILNELYPHYVPVFREGAQESRYPSDRDVIISATVKRAVGGDGPIGNLENSLAQQTRSIFTQGRKNLAVDAVMDSLLKRGDVQELVTDMRYATAAETDGGIETGTDKIIFYRDGARIELSVDPKLAEAFRAFNGYQEGKAGTVLRNINNTYKKLITQWNPTFIVRNFFKDFQDALIYSKYGIKTFTQSYGKALSHIKSNNAWWQLYQSSGGFASSIFENMADADIVKRTGKRSKFGRLVDGISQANMVVEQAPRFAEFIATLESYGMNPQTVTPDVLSEALYNANDITCNFGRSGTWGKMINKYAVPFFNPSIQGFDKLLRAFRAGDAKTAVKQMVSFAAKSAILGASVSILNELLCSLVGDDDDREEYKRMSDYTKNAYYMIPLGNGQFFKIPKGRITSITGNLMQGIVRDIISGDQDENKTDWGAYGESVINNVAPTNPLENMIGMSTIRVLGNNKRWTGQEIENDEDQKKPVSQRYDEKTSGAGKFLSQTLGLSNFGISPKKADALIDETTGVLGDFLLPLTSSQAAQSPLTMGFVTDSNISNKRSGQVYDLKQKLTEQSYMEGTSKVPSVTDLALDFIADSQKAVWDNKDRIREINEQDVNGTEIINLLLGQSPRQNEVSAINLENAEINERILQKFDAFTQSLQQYYNVDEKADEEIQKAQAEEAYLKAYREVMGADDAIKVLSDSKIKAYEKASEKGIGAQTYMDYVISTVHAEKDADRASALLGMELSDDELLGLYTAAIEKDTTKEKNTMEFAVKNGLTPKQFLVKKYGDELSAQSTVSGQSAADEGAAKTVIADAQGYDIPNYKGETLEKIASIGVSVQDYAYVDERLAAHDDKVGYIRSLGFDEKQTRGLVESLVMGKAARSKMTVAADMGIDKDVYTDVYIVGYTSKGSKAERNEQIRAYVDSLPGLSQEQKDALYEWNKVSKGSGSSGSSGRSSGRRSGGSKAAAKKAARLAMEEALGAPGQTLPKLDWSILTKNRGTAKGAALKTGGSADPVQAMVDIHNAITRQQKEKQEEAVMPWLLTAEQRTNMRRMEQEKYQ